MGDATPKPQEAYGRRLMTSIIDDRARSNPQKTFMSIPAGDSVTDGQRDISYAEMARAIHRCAWWVEDTLGKGVDFPSIATYMSPMDFRHAILIFGAIKTGYKVCMTREVTRIYSNFLTKVFLDVLQLSTESPRYPSCALGEAPMHNPLDA